MVNQRNDGLHFESRLINSKWKRMMIEPVELVCHWGINYQIFYLAGRSRTLMEYAAPAYLPLGSNVAGGVPPPQAMAPAQCAPPSLHGGHHYGQEAEEEEEEDELSRYLVPR